MNKSFLYKSVAPWLALSGLVALAFIVVAPFIVPLAWAAIISYASWPYAQRVRTWCHGRDTLAAFVTTFLAAVTLFLPLLWLAWLAQQELSNIYPALQTIIAEPSQMMAFIKKMPVMGEWLSSWLTQHLELFANPEGISDAIQTWLTAHLNELATVAGGIGKNIVKMLFVVIILFFFYRDGAHIMQQIRHVLAKYIGPQTHGYIHAAGSTTRAVVYGVLLTALIQGVVAGLGYWVAGLSSPVIFGVVTALLALVPFCTPLAWGSAGLWLLAQGHTVEAIGIWIWGAAVVSQLDNVLRPIFISSVSRIPFLLVLFGVLGGLLAFGLIGLFIGPIILTVVWAVWREWTAHLDENIQNKTELNETKPDEDMHQTLNLMDK